MILIEIGNGVEFFVIENFAKASGIFGHFFHEEIEHGCAFKGPRKGVVSDQNLLHRDNIGDAKAKEFQNFVFQCRVVDKAAFVVIVWVAILIIIIFFYCRIGSEWRFIQTGWQQRNRRPMIVFRSGCWCRGGRTIGLVLLSFVLLLFMSQALQSFESMRQFLPLRQVKH